MTYQTEAQINQKYNTYLITDKFKILDLAFKIKDDNSSLNKTDCIAISMGFKKCISGSGFYEKQKLTSVSKKTEHETIKI